MPTASRVRFPPLSSSSVVIPDDVPSVAGGPHESGPEFGEHDAAENASEITAAEEEPGRQRHRKKKEDGIPKKPKHQPWEQRFNELAVYKEKNGDCNVPHRQCLLGNWVKDQRKFYNKGKLAQERTAQLEGIGFVWDLHRNQWEDRFNELVVYKEKNNNCNVPQSQGTLGPWVLTQRTLYKAGKLSRECIAQLEGIEFV